MYKNLARNARDCYSRVMLICGIDEAGRGPLAGPVVAAAVVLPADFPVHLLNDSKKLSEARRQELAELIREKAKATGLGIVGADEIDRINILQATMKAMRIAYEAMNLACDLAIIDGNRAPCLPCPMRTLVKADSIEPAVMAASILAKTCRDAIMIELSAVYPAYSFEKHKGYPTVLHYDQIARHGPCAEHRRSFRLFDDA